MLASANERRARACSMTCLDWSCFSALLICMTMVTGKPRKSCADSNLCKDCLKALFPTISVQMGVRQQPPRLCHFGLLRHQDLWDLHRLLHFPWSHCGEACYMAAVYDPPSESGFLSPTKAFQNTHPSSTCPCMYSMYECTNDSIHDCFMYVCMYVCMHVYVCVYA